MIPSYRKRHLSIWMLLGLILPVLFMMAFNARTGVIGSDIQLDGGKTIGETIKKVESEEWGTFAVFQKLDTADSVILSSLEIDFMNNEGLPSAWVEVNDAQGNSFLLGQLVKTGPQLFELPASYSSEESWQLSIQDKIKERILYQTEL
ncbi:MAG: hypothetical protein AAGC85_23640 [Bacteroidota bacterium]